MKNESGVSKFIVSLCVISPFIFEVLSTQFNYKYNVQTIILLYLVSMLYLLYKNSFSIKLNTGGLLKLWFLLIFFSLVSTLLGDNLLLSSQRIITILIPSLFLIILVSNDQNRDGTFLTVIKLFSIFSVLFTVIAIIINYFGYSTFYDNWRVMQFDIGPISFFQRLAGNDVIGVSSLFYNPNNFAAFLLIGLTSSLIIWNLNFINKKKILIRIIIIYIGIIMSMSRTSIILSFLIPVILRFNQAKYSIQHVLIVNASMITAMILAISFFNKLLSIDLTGRDVIWWNLIESIKLNPFFGVGFGLSYEAILEPLGLKGAHNIYLLVLSELGFIGFIVFISLNVIAIMKNIKSLRITIDSKRVLVSGILTMLLMLLIYEVFEGGLLGFSALNFFWVYILTCSYLSLNQKRT